MTDQGESSRPGRILIVDDEPLNVDYLEQELESHGFVTASAANGLEALDRVAAWPPDLILLDVMMPQLDGIATLRILKNDPETKNVPVLLMTALNAVEDRVRGIEAGADDFLSKPVDERELLARIRRSIALKRTLDAAVIELRSTSAHLERFGRRPTEVAVLAVEWRPEDPRIHEDAIGFLSRRQRELASDVTDAFGGFVTDDIVARRQLMAVFVGPDVRSRAITAVEAGLAILDGVSSIDDDRSSPSMVTRAAVSVGSAMVGSVRVTQGDDVAWVWGAEGQLVDDVSSLVTKAAPSELVVSGGVASAINHQFSLRRAADSVYVVAAITEVGQESTVDLASHRFVSTVLVTNVVGYATTIERLGDRAGGELMAAHERALRAELVVHGGEEVNLAGEGLLALFDGPAGAIRCALGMIVRVRQLGLAIRAGVHTGELERVGGSFRGIALNVAAAVAARATPGEVLVTATTRDLSTGSGLGFSERGSHQLAGLSGSRTLFAASEDDPHQKAPSALDTVRVPPHISYPAGLSAREVEVLRLVAVGLTDALVAEQLYLSVRTVNAHLRSIYRKTGVSSRAAASRFATEHGLV